MWCSSTRCCTEAIGAEPALPSAEGTGGGGEVSASARHPSGGFVARLLQGAFSPPPAASNCPRSAGAHEEACGQGERDACASRVPQPHAQGGETPVGDVPLIDSGIVKSPQQSTQTKRAVGVRAAPAQRPAFPHGGMPIRGTNHEQRDEDTMQGQNSENRTGKQTFGAKGQRVTHLLRQTLASAAARWPKRSSRPSRQTAGRPRPFASASSTHNAHQHTLTYASSGGATVLLYTTTALLRHLLKTNHEEGRGARTRTSQERLSTRCVRARGCGKQSRTEEDRSAGPATTPSLGKDTAPRRERERGQREREQPEASREAPPLSSCSAPLVCVGPAGAPSSREARTPVTPAVHAQLLSYSVLANPKAAQCPDDSGALASAVHGPRQRHAPHSQRRAPCRATMYASRACMCALGSGTGKTCGARRKRGICHCRPCLPTRRSRTSGPRSPLPQRAPAHRRVAAVREMRLSKSRGAAPPLAHQRPSLPLAPRPSV